MLTITATRGNYLVLSIPNNNVRKQYYEFMLEEYQDRKYINLTNLGLMYYDMAYDGHWHESLQFIADAYKRILPCAAPSRASATYRASLPPTSAQMPITSLPPK